MFRNNNNKNESWEVVFPELPTTLSMIRALPESDLTEPQYAAALMIPALYVWPTDQTAAIEMLEFLAGPKGLSPRE